MPKFKDKENFKSSKRKTSCYKGTPHNTEQITQKKLSSQKGLHDIFIMLVRQKLPTKNTLSGKVIIQYWREESFSGKQRLKKFITIKLALQEMLKGLL